MKACLYLLQQFNHLKLFIKTELEEIHKRKIKKSILEYGPLVSL
jgi:hypothetical protein